MARHELKDLPQIEKLLSEQEKKLSEVEKELARWHQHVDDYTALHDRLQTLSNQLTHQVMVPLGKLAVAPGRLVHTNEVLVLLGDNWFAEASAAAAAGIADRRRKHCSEMIAKLEREQTLLADWRRQAALLQSEAAETRGIAEPLDEAAEARWRQERRQRVAAARRRETEQRRQHPEPDVMARLDALEKLEADEREMDRLSVSSSEDSDGKLEDDFFVDDLSDDSDDDDSLPPNATTTSAAPRATLSNSVPPVESGAPRAAHAPAERSPIDSDDSDDPAPTPAPSSLKRRVSFSNKESTIHTYDVDAPVTSSPSGGPAGDGPHVAGLEHGRDAGNAELQNQERPQLSQVFSYKIEERTSAANVTTSASVQSPPNAVSNTASGTTRPVSKFRASRSRPPS